MIKIERERRNQQIFELQKEGLSNREIAGRLELTLGTVSMVVYKFGRDGKLIPRPCGRPPLLSQKDRQECEKKIIRLRKKGCNREEIAKAVTMPSGSVAGIVARLIKEGRLERLPCGRPIVSIESRPGYNSKDMKSIIRMVKKGFSLRKMAVVLGCSHEQVRQAISYIKEKVR